jgi:hypothetical protein
MKTRFWRDTTIIQSGFARFLLNSVLPDQLVSILI